MRIRWTWHALVVAIALLPSKVLACPSDKGGFGPPAPFLQPVDAPVSKGFGISFEPLTMRSLFHAGIDFAAEPGSLVHAAQAGRVVFETSDNGAQSSLLILHADDLVTLYRHLGRVDVRDGECVAQGQVIGIVAEAAKHAGSAQVLHFEIRIQSRSIDPTRYLPRPAMSPYKP